MAKKSKSWKKYRKLWKDFRDQKGNRGKKEVVENKKEVVERFLETKSKSWKVVNRGKPPRILKINKKANRGTALKGAFSQLREQKQPRTTHFLGLPGIRT